jgi:hypothetical protein
MMERLDFKKELAQLYNPKNRQWELVEVPAMNFLMVDGKGDPNTARDYSDAVEALFGVAYAIKFRSKKELGQDYGVAPWKGSGARATHRSLRTPRKISTSGR